MWMLQDLPHTKGGLSRLDVKAPCFLLWWGITDVNAPCFCMAGNHHLLQTKFLTAILFPHIPLHPVYYIQEHHDVSNL